MKRTGWGRWGAIALPLALVAAACGGDDEESSPATAAEATTAPTKEAPANTAVAATTVPATTESPDTTTPASDAPATTDGGAGTISSFDEVQPAVIQIEARGTFRDPEIGFRRRLRPGQRVPDQC